MQDSGGDTEAVAQAHEAEATRKQVLLCSNVHEALSY